MAVIESGASVDLLTIDPTAKAARVLLYAPDGTPLVYPSLTGRSVANVLVRQSAATAAGASVWGLHEPTAGRTIYITKIWLKPSFDGAAALTHMRYELIKATGVTSFTGGVVVTPLIKRTSIGAPNAVARVLDTGLTLTGATFGGAFYTLNYQRILSGAALATTMGYITGPVHVLEFNPPIELAQNEALAIRNGPTNASVIGDTLMGGVEFQEST